MMEYLVSITLWNVALLGLMLLLQPLVRVVVSGLSYAVSNFDTRIEEGVFARRLSMVCANQIEALVLWVPVIVAAVALESELEHPHFALIATIFLFARLAYATVSLAGIPVLRSGAWIVGFAAWGYLVWIIMIEIAR